MCFKLKLISMEGIMNVSDKWVDYECLASGNGEKLERYGNIILNRPDPQIIWEKSDNQIWNSWDGYYHRSSTGGGSWEFRKKLPDYAKTSERPVVIPRPTAPPAASTHDAPPGPRRPQP